MITNHISQRLGGKIALVTGGSSGIGLATARRLLAEGAYVIITGRRKEVLDEAVQMIGPDSITAICGDVSNLRDVDRVFATIAKDVGALDIVFANAGSGSLLPLGSITEQQVDGTFATNVKGVVFTVQGALPLLRAGGSVILNASTTSIKGTPGFSIYSASKAAVRNLARSWIIDLRGRDIRVNVVSPGVVPTPGYDGLGLSADDIQAFIDLQVKNIPLGRVGMADEVAKVVSFLASDDSSFINGVELFVDGGMTQI
jgi:NAD(P)-dependent dehydrogenase (short-subunit alcohol dehydrogenase family)